MNPYSRQVSAGTTFLSPTDFYVEVDTSFGEVTIVLPNITTIMEIVAKLGITFAGIRFVDVSNNASINNIIIVSGGTDLVNDVTSITLNTDGVGGLVTTLSGSQWAYTQNSVASGGGGGNAVILLGGGTGSSYRCGNGNLANGGYSTVSGGRQNTASSKYSTVSGGYGNTASGGYYSKVGGGYFNTASGYIGSVVSGGISNIASDIYSTVSGGYSNIASGYSSTIGGGIVNTASGRCSTISGGVSNTASCYFSAILGGSSNTASSRYSSVGGGSNNSINPFTTCAGYFVLGNTIGGGSNNIINSNSAYNNNAGGVTISGGVNNTTNSGYYGFNTIGGGRLNIASCDYSTIGGGRQNTASGYNSTISGGINNTVSDCFSSVGGGIGNISSGNSSTISGGYRNSASSQNSTISGGSCNITSCRSSTVSGGYCNTASSYYSTVSGGYCNLASGNGSAVLGGINNIASGCYSGAFGCNLTASCNYTFYTNNHCACGSLYTSAITSGCAVCSTTGGQLIGYTPIPPNYGLYAQTANSTPITGTIVESSLIGSGLGTLSVPANSFQVGDSFVAKLYGHITCVGTATIQIRIKSGSVLLADTGIITLDVTTNKHWNIEVNFTIRSLGIASVGSIVSAGLFSYIKNSGLNFEGANFVFLNNTTFDTTILNTLDITAQWNTNNAGNSIYSDVFVLNKTY